MQPNTPEYEKPPLIEVICGVQFEALEAMFAAHVGMLWSRFRNDFPIVQEVPPLADVFEHFDDGTQDTGVTFSAKPPLPRTWFVSRNKNLIVQTQRDRFMHNWRKVLDTDEYPRFERVFKSFQDRLAVFEDFAEQSGFGELAFNQFEMTYVNVLAADNGSLQVGRVGEYFKDISWENGGRSLPSPESMSLVFTFSYPDDRIRLHIKAQTAERGATKDPVIRLELTARGMPKEKSKQAMNEWFSAAHERIVFAFADISAEEVQQKHWKRIR